ncbi:MAG: SDR family oxidoreductase [Candidatus Binataceae bacterium]|nr:SDR family oxidoreductase [Candidatus Binataceae bacterium]
MDLQLRGKVAVVTGASAGIGFGTARVLAQEGAQTVLVARRKERLEKLAREISQSGGATPLVVSADLRDREAPRQVATEVLGKLGHADILVNNAGGSRPLAIDADDHLWDEALSVNFTAVRKMAQAFLPAMRERRWGRIINITGSLEPRGVNGANVAKAGVHVWAKGLSCDIAKDGITVNCIGPGRIHSEQIDERLHPTPESQAAYAAANIPMGYFGDVEDIAYLIAFLSSEKARYITGQRLYVDGGMHRAI